MLITDFLLVLLDKHHIKEASQRGLKYLDIHLDAVNNSLPGFRVKAQA
jgi:hypothetical protein